MSVATLVIALNAESKKSFKSRKDEEDLHYISGVIRTTKTPKLLHKDFIKWWILFNFCPFLKNKK